MFNPYKKPMPAAELAKKALAAWMDDPASKISGKDAVTEHAVADAIMAAQNHAYDEAAELVVRYGHISSDLARQHIQGCKWANPFPFDAEEG